jgi:hypothetical protein
MVNNTNRSNGSSNSGYVSIFEKWKESNEGQSERHIDRTRFLKMTVTKLEAYKKTAKNPSIVSDTQGRRRSVGYTQPSTNNPAFKHKSQGSSTRESNVNSAHGNEGLEEMYDNLKKAVETFIYYKLKEIPLDHQEKNILNKLKEQLNSQPTMVMGIVLWFMSHHYDINFYLGNYLLAFMPSFEYKQGNIANIIAKMNVVSCADITALSPEKFKILVPGSTINMGSPENPNYMGILEQLLFIEDPNQIRKFNKGENKKLETLYPNLPISQSLKKNIKYVQMIDALRKPQQNEMINNTKLKELLVNDTNLKELLVNDTNLKELLVNDTNLKKPTKTKDKNIVEVNKTEVHKAFLNYEKNNISLNSRQFLPSLRIFEDEGHLTNTAVFVIVYLFQIVPRNLEDKDTLTIYDYFKKYNLSRDQAFLVFSEIIVFLKHHKHDDESVKKYLIRAYILFQYWNDTNSKQLQTLSIKNLKAKQLLKPKQIFLDFIEEFERESSELIRQLLILMSNEWIENNNVKNNNVKNNNVKNMSIDRFYEIFKQIFNEKIHELMQNNSNGKSCLKYKSTKNSENS